MSGPTPVRDGSLEVRIAAVRERPTLEAGQQILHGELGHAAIPLSRRHLDSHAAAHGPQSVIFAGPMY